ncbi:MAG: class I SAM-dependent methyltransferase [Actinomycetota bacterium]|nr:class I SAM-dependent methyltransferase [Actinomycetota bacterium]
MSAPPESTNSPSAPRLDDDALVEALTGSQRLGMLGAAPIAHIIEHSGAFLAPLVDVSGTVVDLGSGGGVPGLVIAWMRPDVKVVLVDRRATRTDHLQRMAHRLGREAQITVLTTEAAALPGILAGRADAVVARSFGPPESVLSAAIPILSTAGILVVSEPPDGSDADRWPAPLLNRFNLNRRDPTDSRVAVLTRRPS